MLARSLVLALALAGALPAQALDGSYVVSAFHVGQFIGPAGLFLVSRSGNKTGPVLNLPPEVTAQAVTVGGPDFVLTRPDGVIVTDGYGALNAPMPVFFLTLQGNMVSAATRYDVGTVTSATSRGLPQAHLLPSGAVVIAIDDQTVGVPGEPLHGALLGIVDPTAGAPGMPNTLRPIPITPRPPGDINAMTVDPRNGAAYLGMTNSGNPSTVWRVPFPTGGVPAQVATLPDTLTGLATDNDGTLIATASGSGGLHRIDPATGQVTWIGTGTNYNGVAVERATGLYVVVEGAPGTGVQRIAPNGTGVVVSNGPSSGWGTLNGVTVAHNPVEYGRGTPGTLTSFWKIAPNPGGLPQVGNQNFSLAVVTRPTAPLGTGIVLSTGPQIPPLSLLGVEVFVDPVGVVLTVFGSGSNELTVPLPIPGDPSLIGAVLYLQAFQIESGSVLSSSSGVRMRVM